MDILLLLYCVEKRQNSTGFFFVNQKRTYPKNSKKSRKLDKFSHIIMGPCDDAKKAHTTNRWIFSLYSCVEDEKDKNGRKLAV